jgi:hypothetical protein
VKRAERERLRKRNVLAEARKATQGKLATLAGAGMLMGTFFRTSISRETPWLPLACLAIGVALAIRWIGRYRRLRAELGLQNEYDELDENTTMLSNTLLVLFGVFGGMFILIAVLVFVLGKH